MEAAVEHDQREVLRRVFGQGESAVCECVDLQRWHGMAGEEASTVSRSQWTDRTACASEPKSLTTMS